jgi:hypothetical protein
LNINTVTDVTDFPEVCINRLALLAMLGVAQAPCRQHVATISRTKYGKFHGFFAGSIRLVTPNYCDM